MTIFLGILAEAPQVPLAEVYRRLGGPGSGFTLEFPAPRLGLLRGSGSFGAGAWTVATSGDGLVAMVAARLDESDSLRDRVGVEPGASEADIVLAAYRRWGRALPRFLEGDFALAVWDAGERTLLCAVDPLGIGALFTWGLPGNGFAVASHPTPLRHLAGPGLRFDYSTLARSLCRLPVDRSKTSFEGIARVEPGSCVVVTPAARTVTSYWSPEDLPIYRFCSSEEGIEVFRGVLVTAVERRLKGVEVLAIAQSGGLDSSSVLCLAAAARGRPRLLPIYVAPEEASCNEADGVALLEERTGLECLIRRPATDLRALQEVGYAMGDPCYLDHFAMAWSALRGARDAGASRLLTGLYGDLVSGTVPRSAWLPSLLRERAWATWWDELPARAPAGSLLQSLWPTARGVWGSVRRLPTFEAALRRDARHRRDHWFGGSCLSDSAARDIELDVEEERFLIDVEHTHRDVAFARAAWLRAAIPSETELVGRAAGFLGLEVAHPLADLNVIAVSLSLPLTALRGDGLNRYPLRAAVRGLVPDGIRSRPRKVTFNDLYRGMFERLVPELARLPLAAALEPLLSSERLARLVQKGTWSYPEGAHLWRCLALNAWVWQHSVHG